MIQEKKPTSKEIHLVKILAQGGPGRTRHIYLALEHGKILCTVLSGFNYAAAIVTKVPGVEEFKMTMVEKDEPTWSTYFKKTAMATPEFYAVARITDVAQPIVPGSVCHYLKTWPEYFHAICVGRKKFDVRFNDRGFRVNDVVVLQEWEPATEKFTGRQTARLISYILDNPDGTKTDITGLKPGFVILSI